MMDNTEANPKEKMPPWMSKEEMAFIESYINKDSIMLEYGCGGSTLHFPDYVKKYCSIESDGQWYQKVSEQAREDVAMILIPPKAAEGVIFEAEKQEKFSPDYNWDNLDKSIFYKIFEDYIEAHQAFGVQKFDAILIDGRARQHVAKSIYDFIDENTVVFIHDFFPRKHYHFLLEKYRTIGQVLTGQTMVALQKS